MGVAGSLQKVGVIGDEGTIAGQQQLAAFQSSDKSIATLSSGMVLAGGSAWDNNSNYPNRVSE